MHQRLHAAGSVLSRLFLNPPANIDPFFDPQMLDSWPLEDPRSRGKGLVGDKSGLWRWRVGDYRVIAAIYENTVTVTVVDLGHRREVYD